MQRDKATLLYQGRSQLDRAVELLRRHVEPGVRLGARRSQSGDPRARAIR